MRQLPKIQSTLRWNRPCQRCEKNSAQCQYHDAVKDEAIIRIEKLEQEMQVLREQLNRQCSHVSSEPVLTPMTSYHAHERDVASRNAVEAGLITWDQAEVWFQR